MCAEEIAGPVRFVPADRIPELSWWAAFRRRLEIGHAHFDSELQKLLGRGLRVRRAHGDFGRNNIVISAGVPWVFDWEESCDDAPVKTDELAFWPTSHARRIAARPAAMLAVFADRFLSDQSPEARLDAMMALAFQQALGWPPRPR